MNTDTAFTQTGWHYWSARVLMLMALCVFSFQSNAFKSNTFKNGAFKNQEWQTQNPPLNGLKRVGQSRLKVLFWNVYDSSLYTIDGTYKKAHYPIALRINYLRDIDAEDLLKQTQKEWQHQNISHPQIASWLTELATLWPDLKKGDELIFRVDKNLTNQFYYNQQPIGGITHPDFSPLFLAIWLSEKSRYSNVRNKLIFSK